ncbi:MAG: helix-turn-helix domain-containing protein [Hyphomonas sp.]
MEQKPNRNERRRRRTREMILEAADVVFRRKGVNSATVNDITDEADVAYGSFYNHFDSMEDLVAARAELTMQRVQERVVEVLKHADRVELLPCIGARVIMRVHIGDPAIRWMMERPYIFVDEMIKMGQPFMLEAEAEAVADGRLKPAGGHACWLRTFPWLLIAELKEALKEDRALTAEERLVHEERFALVSLRFLGVDDKLAQSLVAESRHLVDDFDLTDVEAPAVPKKSRRAVAGS